MKLFLYVTLIALVTTLSACRPYEKEVPSGTPLKLKQVYSNPSYDYNHLIRVAVLPIDNIRSEESVLNHLNQMEITLLSNFAKRGDLDLHIVTGNTIVSRDVMNGDSNRIDRTLIGRIGEEYGAQAILHVSIIHYRPYPPLQLHAKAVLVSVQTGERIWSVEQVFDQNDANVVNGMRHWWNGQRAGGLDVERFEVSSISSNSFIDYCFFSLANSFANERIANCKAAKKLADLQKK